MNRREFLKFGAVGAALPLVGCAMGQGKGGGAAANPFAGLEVLPPAMPNARVVKGALKGKTACKYIDDCIWFLRDIARTRPTSAFDHPFLAGLRRLHEKYGLKTQLNLFYRTDYFYGMDEFSLAAVPADYKGEFQKNADWLKFGFHALQEFPDYPWVNSSYEDVAKCLDMIHREVSRFAGDNMFARALIPHWVPMSKDGIRALSDGGIKIVFSTDGNRYAYNGDPDVLPYGHSFRLMCDRKPETALFVRGNYLSALTASICGYNHITSEQSKATSRSSALVYDPDTKMNFRSFCTGPMSCINCVTIEQLAKDLQAVKDAEFVGYGHHEQYFYKDYFNYQPDYMAKEELCAKTLAENGFGFCFMEDLS